MGLSEAQLRTAIDTLVGVEPAFAAALERAGYPPPRIRERGYATLLRTIVGQQVSIKAANSIWNKVESALDGRADDPAVLAAADDETLRGAGLSRQKVAYARGLAEAVLDGRIDFAALPEDDEEAIMLMSSLKGIGRWSAEIYLLFAEGRPDIWPAGDLAVQIEIGRILGLEARPTERQTRALAEGWRPHRGAAAIFAWHHYNAELGVLG